MNNQEPSTDPQELRSKFSTVSEYLNRKLIGSEHMIEASLVTALAGDNIYIVGPPGVGKSYMARLLASCFSKGDETQGSTLEIQFSMDTTKDDCFGPLDLKKLFPDEGDSRYVRMTNMQFEGSPQFAPQADILIMDEPANASTDTLKAFHSLLEERAFFDGETLHNANTQLVIGTANEVLPKANYALDSRFGCRVRVDLLSPSDEDRYCRILMADGVIGKGAVAPSLTLDELAQAREQVKAMPFAQSYSTARTELSAVARLNNVKIDGRNWEKALVLCQAYAWFTGASTVLPAHLYFAKNVLWKQLADADLIEELVEEVVAKEAKEIAAMLASITQEHSNAPTDLLHTVHQKADGIEQCKAAFSSIAVYIHRMRKTFEASPVLDKALSQAKGVRNTLAGELVKAKVPAQVLKALDEAAKKEVG